MLKYIIIVLCVLQLLKELFQMYQLRFNYLGWQNLIEWLIFGCPIYLVVDQNDCQRETNLRDHVQWQVGAIVIFLAWINLLLFIRPTKRFGIYIVMFTEVLKTFRKVFLILLLFIIAFALSFHMLMANQISFSSVGSALIKTSVMMTGEFGFEPLFNDRFTDGGDHTAQVYFSIATYIVFVVFLVVMSIILMNLLVGLAVGDIKSVQDQAKLKRLAMKVELIVNMEILVPDFIRRRFAIRTQELYPNSKTCLKTLNRKLKIKSQHSAAKIRSTLQPEKTQTHERLKRLETMMEAMDSKMKDMDSNMKDIDSKMNKVLSMIETMMNADKDKHSYSCSED